MQRTNTTAASLFHVLLLLWSSIHGAGAWSAPSQPTRTAQPDLRQPQHQEEQMLSRRDALRQASAAASAMALLIGRPGISLAATNTDALIEDLVSSEAKIKEIPDLLQAQEWDKVRTILKTPPVNKLWNLGDSQNPILSLAKETGNVEWFEIKDELAYQLQMTDQLTYDNVFVYFQPGSGKIKIKEPTEAAQKAMQQLGGIISEAKGN